MTDVAVPARRRVSLRLAIVQLVVLGLVVWFLVVPQLRGSSHTLHLLTDLDNGWIGLSAVAELASLLVFGMATRALLRRHTRPSLHRVIRIDLSTIALSHCLPAGAAAGSALGWRLLTRAGVPSADAWFVKLVQGFGSVVVLQSLLLVGIVLALPSHGIGGWAGYLAASDGCLALLGALLAVAARRPVVRRLGRAFHARLARPPHLGFRGRGRGALAGFVRTAQHQVSMMLSDRRRLLTAAAWATANWAFDCMALWAALHAYGRPVSLGGLALAFAIANTVAWLPITPSGLGVTEGVMIPLLVIFGATRPVATLGVLTWRVMSFWLPIPLGAVAYGTLRSWRRPAAIEVPALEVPAVARA